MLLRTYTAVAFAITRSAWAKLYTDPSQVPKTSYDYVVIGAGIGGAVVASRLSENPRVTVLLLEAGISDQNVSLVEVPFLDTQTPASFVDWNYTTTPQPGLNGRAIEYPCGKILGGGSSVNFMGWNHASKDYWERFANVTGDYGWSWDAVQPYFHKIEKLTPPVDHHDTTGQINPAAHGTSGPLGISVEGFSLPTDQRVIGTTQELSSEFPFILDQNAGVQIGVGWTQSTISNGSRTSSSSAYLTPNLQRPNLDVVVNAQATRLVETHREAGLPAFQAVEFARAATSERVVVNATKEVILSAGAVASPKLLMLSGIGPSAQLEAVGIKTIVDAPGVGQNLQDHPLLSNFWSVNSTGYFTIDDIRRNTTLFNELMAEWQSERQGMFVLGNPNQMGWKRIPSNASIFQKVPDPSSGPFSPHIEMLPFNGWVSYVNPPPDTGHYLTIYLAMVSPASRGNITLASSDPFTYPIVNPNLLGHEFDKYAMRFAINASRAFTAAQAWNGWILGEAGDLPNVHTIEELDAYAANNTANIFHPAGTVAIDFVGGQGVLNTDLTVKGTKGLRIVDLSVVPFIPEAHPQAATYVIAERASDLIKASH